MQDFVFGSMATTERRAAFAKMRQWGVKHLNRMAPRVPGPGDAPELTVTVELNRQIKRVECVVSEPETAVYPLHLARTEWDLLNWSYYQVWQVTLPHHPIGSLVRYQILAHPADGGQPIGADEGATFSYLVSDPYPPAWSRKAVVYQIFPDRFNPGNGRAWPKTDDLNHIHGGDIRGIIEKLDYIADLGFNCLWINPFFPDDTHHGYHATDYFAVNPRMGTLADVRELVQAAHQRGIRLLLDFVANHWGHNHNTFVAAQADRESEFHDWYHWREWPHEYESFFGVQALPKLNTDNPDVRAHLLNSVRFWLGDVGFDGLRLDYALGPTHDFWTDLRAVVKKVRPNAWMFGEAVDAPDVQLSYDGRFDGNIDFMLGQALRDTFALGKMDLAAFDAFLNQHEAYFPARFSRPSFLDNHDMNRFLFLANGDKRKLKLAALCQFTLSGPPIVYNGSEIGLSQNKAMADPSGYGMAECRQPMPWQDGLDQELRAFFRQLIHFRHEHPALRDGRRQTIHVHTEPATYAYLLIGKEENILVAFNLSDDEQTIRLDVPEQYIAQTIKLPPGAGKVWVNGKMALDTAAPGISFQ